ncbi:hypothetical protein GCM10011514_25840 [Emticicia aquatilis]|uniref:Uncharacterized protein n=1 Tax=Emticicia aquatilis TaxID=1537369 RepID=A0A916YU61_9BACT|nr:hypothetical protein [Emticicia aquatilis]GGD60720.1 hypothetical protein GCM10011514_25840 [Emticicia aquatilis]
MVDFVKFKVANFKEITTNSLLKFICKQNKDKTKSHKEANYNGFTFKSFDSGYLIVSGSLHKYYNEGEHNHNDFTFSMLQLVVEDLQNKFHFNLDDCYLQNIELGVNIVPVINTQSIIEGLVVHKNKDFDTRKRGFYKQAHHSQYYLKVYNKANQYNLSGQLMRFELKFIKMERLKKLGIRKLSDLQENHWIDLIQDVLLYEWDKILLFDKSINIDSFTNKRQLQLHRWKDSNYWLHLEKNKRYRELKQYKKIVSQYSDLIQDRTKDIIKDKWISLSLL